jgi:recombination protein RecT
MIKMSDQELVKKETTMSERFMNKIILEFNSGVGDLALTTFQKRLAQNCFIVLDSALKAAEEKRLKKTQNQDAVPVTWANVNMEKLSRDVVAVARIGLDPAQKNHINMIPFKNNALGKYDIGFVEGYRGMELKATKYGLDVPDHVVVEVVYSNDKFKSIKKDIKNKYEHYEFDIVNDFDRGTIVGGFYYHMFIDHPEKNKVVTLSLKDIEKRKPQYASVEFWGGEKDVWEKDKTTGKSKKTGKETIDGWFEKMVEKTIRRAAYGDITIDSQKIDDDYLMLKQSESSLTEAEALEEINANANGTPIDIEHGPASDELTDEPNDNVEAEGQPTNQAAPKPGPNF